MNDDGVTKTKVLVVEDDPLLARMYRRALTLAGFSVETAENGQDGLEKARANKPEIMLVDMMMPVMNGLDLLAELKADPVTKDIPAVMLTNLFDTQQAEEAVKRGAIRYVIKSDFELSDITAMIQTITGGAKI